MLEIIPGPDTDPAVLSFLEDYGQRVLGKVTVLCKDTPAFIANRIGVFGIMGLFHLVEEMGLTVEEVDRLTGPVLGRPKSATFRTADVVGLDTLVKVAQGVKDNCPNDEQQRALHHSRLPAADGGEEHARQQDRQGLLLQGPRAPRARSWRST